MAHPNSLKNLKPLNQTSEEARAAGRLGGIASGVTRRNRKKFQDVLDAMLDMSVKKGPMTDIDKIRLLADLKGKNITVKEAMLLSQVSQALNGDLSALKYITEMLGEQPTPEIKIDQRVRSGPLEDILEQLQED